ncbi:right-handed parallel beta-helix repeat-containing protein, partial [[Eubacterium] cellulosolvens]
MAAATTHYVGGGGLGNWSKIQDAIDIAFAGDIIRVYPGRYYENLTVNKTLTLIGNSTIDTIIDGGGLGDVVYISANWVNITNFTITNGSRLTQHGGIMLKNSQKCCIYNNTVSFNINQGIYLSYSTNNHIIANNISSNKVDGIYLSHSTNNHIIANNLSLNKAKGIHLSKSSNNHIIANNVSWNNLYLSSISSGIFLRTSANNNITGNNVSWNNKDGICLYDSSNNNIIKSNNVSWSKDDGIYLQLASFNNITDNNAMHNRNGIYLYDSTNNNIIRNNVSRNKDDNIYFSGSSHNNIIGNNVSQTIDDGIYLQAASNNNIISNNVFSNKDDGIYLFCSLNNNLTDNNVSLNNGAGINFYNSPNNNITCNNVSSNKIDGIYLKDDSNRNIISGNNISLNTGDGIYLYDSSNNNIIYNNVSSNTGDGISFNYNSKKNTITKCNITDNYRGILFQSSSNASVHNNWIVTNTDYGIKNIDPVILINAIHNWWGSNTGPYDPSDDRATGGWYNPTGTGDKVSDYVEFKPWLGFIGLPPVIINSDVTTINEDTYYEVEYNASDPNWDYIEWLCSSNATWLNWGSTNHTLYGTPRNEHVGSYWVRINISDALGGYDEHNFTLTVVNTNDRPNITTTDITSAIEDSFYEVTYTATEIDVGDTVTWTYDSNATAWLNWCSTNHTLFGTPQNEHVGSYWVKINVSDNHNGYDEHYFNLTVINTNDKPIIDTTAKTNL